MRRSSWMPAACFVILAMVVGGWYGLTVDSGDRAGVSNRIVAAMADVQSVPASAPRMESFDLRHRPVAPNAPDAAVLLFSASLTLAGAAFLRRQQPAPRPPRRRAHSISLRGPPLRAAL